MDYLLRKLLPALDAQKSKEERLPIVISYGNNEQLIGVPMLEISSGSELAQAFCNAIEDWNLEDKVKMLCCHTTASNTGDCVLLKKKNLIEKCLFLLAATTCMNWC